MELFGGCDLRERALAGQNLLVQRVVVECVRTNLADPPSEGEQIVALLLHIGELVAQQVEGFLIRVGAGCRGGELQL